jgi:sulfur carrier protein ThiS
MVIVKVLGREDSISIPGVKKGTDILKSLGLNANSSILLKNGKPIPEDSGVEEGDSITVIRSFSGG